MQSHNEKQPDPAAASRGNETGDWADWNTPKPAIIPPPTYWPFILSLGATLMGLGILTSNIITATGVVFFILGVTKWVGELTSEGQ